MGIAMSIPIVIGIASNHLGIGIAICFGAFWSSPSNTNGNYRHKKISIVCSAVLVTIVSFISGYLDFTTWLLIPVLGILTFIISYIAVYGFRASMISFSGLLALVLSFAHSPSELAMYQYSLLTGLGGLWYLLLVMTAHRLNPGAQTKEFLYETFELTAHYLKNRGKLMGQQPDRSALQRQLQILQTDLIEHHETLRDILFSTRKDSGNSVYQNKQLLIFVQLVEMLETAMANPVDYAKMDALYEKHQSLKGSFQNIIFEISKQLLLITQPSKSKDNKNSNQKVRELLETARKKINIFNQIHHPEEYEQFVILQNLLEYQEKQFEKLCRIQWLQRDQNLDASEFIAGDVLKRFLVSQDYDPKLWLRNFSFKSAVFKHSLRLAATVMIGYLIGVSFAFQNPYWILLTIIVIMRPSYGLTKTRSKDRITGTLIGAVVAAGIVVFIHNPYIQGAIGFISIVLAFSVTQKNYKVSAVFVTLSVVFIYAIVRPDILVVIQYRILDTLIGAALCYLAILWLWPAWGFLEIKQHIKSSVRANNDFFDRITKAYIEKGELSTGYKVARKTAFLETSNLNAAFQRMVQEPKSKQKGIDHIYELVVLNHTLLSSLASLSTYLQYHQTHEASENFCAAVKMIGDNLAKVQSVLDSDKNYMDEKIEDPSYKKVQKGLTNLTFMDIEAMVKAASQTDRNYQEAHLVWEQLRWFHSLSVQMLELIVHLKLK